MHPTFLKPAIPALAALLAATAHGSAAAAETDAAKLARITDQYFEAYLQLNPVAATFIGDHRYDDRLPPEGPAERDAALALERRSREALATVDRSRLDAAEQLNHDVFAFNRQLALDGAAYPAELLPLDQFNNPALFFAQLGSGTTAQPFVTVKDYDNFLARMRAFPAWADQVIAWMREGVRRGVVQPRVVMEKVLPQLAAMAGGPPEQSVFWKPVDAMPAAFPSPERARLTAAYRRAIGEQVMPAYRRMHDYVRDEYLPKARSTVGLSALPDGAAWYAYLARGYTTTSTPVAEIHDIGLREVARIGAEITALGARIGFRGDVSALADSMRHDPRFTFRKPEDLVNAYRSRQALVEREIPRLFSLVPKSPLEIRPMESFREQAAAAAEYYQPAADGARPGIFFVNTYDLPARPAYELDTIFLHEAIPGHHFQLALAVENESLPRFRRYGADVAFGGGPDPTTAYTEGWGLYAESLGDQLGLYRDSYQKLGNLFAESWRAARLVIDSGLHAQGWSREQAIAYMLANTASSRAEAIAEVERYIAWPGQALAYKTGQMTFLRLRSRAEQALGERFDVREFHAQVLGSGALPLSLLEAKIDRWIDAGRRNGGTH
jgi:uncharacterized protein (DUF885 family)